MKIIFSKFTLTICILLKWLFYKSVKLFPWLKTSIINRDLNLPKILIGSRHKKISDKNVKEFDTKISKVVFFLKSNIV